MTQPSPQSFSVLDTHSNWREATICEQRRSLNMRNSVSMTKARTLIIGHFASLAAFAAAMILVTPLMANPAMCGLPNNNANYSQVISGFTYDASTKTYTFIDAAKGTPIMVGTWLAVLDTITGKKVPVALEQPLTLRGNGKYHSNAPAIPAPAFAQNSELISGIPSNQVAPVCVQDKMCNTTLTKLPATFDNVISGFTFDQSTETYTFTDAPSFPLGLGSFVEVTIKKNNKDVQVPASIVKFRGESLFTPVNKKDLSQGYTMGGYLYIQPGDSATQAQRLNITITQQQMQNLKNAAKNGGGGGVLW